MDDNRNLPATRSGQVATRSSFSSLTLALHNLTPATSQEFAKEVMPALVLVVPVGMSAEDRRAWLHAAHKVLEGVPLDLLQRGTLAAMRAADHPSKIVAAIMKEIEVDWQWRRDHPLPVHYEPPPAPVEKVEISEEEKAVVREKMAELVAKMKRANP